jgi:hypothetical protein
MQRGKGTGFSVTKKGSFSVYAGTCRFSAESRRDG